jgi:hypothetical protein
MEGKKMVVRREEKKGRRNLAMRRITSTCYGSQSRDQYFNLGC